MKKAYLIDSSIYVFRGWFTMPEDLVDRDGHPVNALYGFADFLIQLLENEQPSHIACAFDQNSGNCWRRKIFPEYKANREPAPEELKRQFQYCRELVNLAGIAHYASDRYEADDIIGTLSRHLRKHGFNSVIVTGDKDLTQLVREGDLWWEFAKNKRLDSKGVEKTWGVKPEQIACLLALIGDKVDNIEGIPGVGPKTAANLLVKFGSAEAVLENIDKIGEMKFRAAKRIQNLVNMHQDKVRLAKQLTVIPDDPEVPCDPSAISRGHYDADALESFFDHIGFGQLRRQRWHRALSSQVS